MATPFIGEIRLLPFTFAPVGWLLCDGRLLQIQQYTALYTIIGTIYGRGGANTFRLPNLPGQAVVGAGHAPGLSTYALGQTAGAAAVTLNSAQLPTHGHDLRAELVSPATTSNMTGTPSATAALSRGQALVGTALKPTLLFASAPDGTVLAPTTIGATPGPTVAHDNQQPYLNLQYCIAYDGDYPEFP